MKIKIAYTKNEIDNHLYLVSENAEIKKSDWFNHQGRCIIDKAYDVFDNKIIPCDNQHLFLPSNREYVKSDCKKVIFSTNPKLLWN